MDFYIKTPDGVNIYYQITGSKPTAMLFVHGALGNTSWWNAQRDYFKDDYTIALMDLPGHGKSGSERTNWSAEQYAQDIKTVADQLPAEKIILVGHSMSGPYTLAASLLIPNVKLVILVDTLKNMNQLMDIQQAEELIFKYYRNNFKDAVENMLPHYLFAASTPAVIKEQLQKEFLQYSGEFAAASLAPLYKMDIRSIAKQVTVPVIAINSDAAPVDVDSIRQYIPGYDYKIISGTGHYPMLEKPNEFNLLLSQLLKDQPI